jgi:hypothetical protein
MRIKEGAHVDGFSEPWRTDASSDPILHAFDVSAGEASAYANAEVLFAAYGGGAYEGAAEVVFRMNGDLYEVTGSHCSCNGLEGQWEPAKVNVGYLQKRKLSNYDYSNETLAAFAKMVSELGA